MEIHFFDSGLLDSHIYIILCRTPGYSSYSYVLCILYTLHDNTTLHLDLVVRPNTFSCECRSVLVISDLLNIIKFNVYFSTFMLRTKCFVEFVLHVTELRFMYTD